MDWKCHDGRFFSRMHPQRLYPFFSTASSDFGPCQISARPRGTMHTEVGANSEKLVITWPSETTEKFVVIQKYCGEKPKDQWVNKPHSEMCTSLSVFLGLDPSMVIWDIYHYFWIYPQICAKEMLTKSIPKSAATLRQVEGSAQRPLRAAQPFRFAGACRQAPSTTGCRSKGVFPESPQNPLEITDL